MADGDDITVLQRMLFNQLAVYVCSVSAIQVFEEGVIQDVDDQGVVSTERRYPGDGLSCSAPWSCCIQPEPGCPG
jgi:hypothetical protein